MATETEIAWPRYLALARAVLAALALALCALLVAPVWPAVLAVQAVFLLAALAVLWRRVEPSGMPATARICCSNCEVTAPSSVQ